MVQPRPHKAAPTALTLSPCITDWVPRVTSHTCVLISALISACTKCRAVTYPARACAGTSSDGSGSQSRTAPSSGFCLSCSEWREVLRTFPKVSVLAEKHCCPCFCKLSASAFPSSSRSSRISHVPLSDVTVSACSRASGCLRQSGV